MFESLKKKFSRTSEQLEEELKEEAMQEDNFQEESGKRFSFFSFGRKKEEEDADESTLLPEAEEDEEKIIEDTPEIEELEEDSEATEEKKSRFWSRNKDKDEEDSEEDEDSDDGSEEKKSHFWSRNKDKYEEDSEEDSEEEESGEKKSHFWSRNKNKEDISADGEASGGLFSFVREKTIQEKHVEDVLWDLEMGLLEGDVAMEVATEVVESVKNNLVGKKIKRSNDITELTYNALRDSVAEIIDVPGKSMTEMIEEKKVQGEPLVVMFVGINGTGKTTTIGKLANYYLKKGYTPVIAASDTFRAGAIEQVTYHADNVGVKIIKHQKGSDPAAVAYDAVEHARAQGKELVLIDTAGRMQTNTNLMDEMKKIKRVANPDLVIFVGDALTGNDATEQAAKFNEAIDIDGVILTKADADSKGGASLSIGYVIKKPIMFLGVGQGYDDIMEYDAEWMLNQLFSEDETAVEALEE
ncbi:signal recognition particle-docking protein FtsY [uncultured Methanobrevibacter sp.]|uniref:signal recognition particle-docking protein FtsY n=1 Tax=uncultured Methanobrevibacter sp. TaxID=253161 RepID=UPI00261D1D82|nr:signal recognition particle-docking protein FtsY [uncultured Methanobrevibacter sp.]